MAEEGAVLHEQSEQPADLLLSPQGEPRGIVRSAVTLVLYTGCCLTLRSDRATYEINGTGLAAYQYQRTRRGGERPSGSASRGAFSA